MADSSRAHQAGPTETHHRQPARLPEQQSETALAAEEALVQSLQRLAAGRPDPRPSSPGAVLRLQRSIGNRAVSRALTRRTAPHANIISRVFASSAILQRALLPKLSAEPAYKDGLALATIKSTALDKPPRPKKEGADWTGKLNAAARKVFKDTLGITDQSLFDANLGDAKLLQPGEIHGNQVYNNKSGDLPGTTTYKEYDIAKYLGDPRLRGGERVVTGADGKNYYTDTHYVDFAEF